MDTPDRDEAAGARIMFGRFALDRARGSLHSGDRELILRPETWAVLRFLAEHPDRTVAAADLLAAGWPGVVSDDDLLSLSIDEIRRVLSDSEARLVVTVPGVGFRCVAAAAPGERRKARVVHLLRGRGVYGLLAPLLLAITVAVLLFLGRE